MQKEQLTEIYNFSIKNVQGEETTMFLHHMYIFSLSFPPQDTDTRPKIKSADAPIGTISLWKNQQDPIKILIRLALVYKLYAYQVHPVAATNALSLNGQSHTARSWFLF